VTRAKFIFQTFELITKNNSSKLASEKKKLTAELEYSATIIKMSEACAHLGKSTEGPDPFAHDSNVTNPFTKKSSGGCIIL